jgi:hypothetical protein
MAVIRLRLRSLRLDEAERAYWRALVASVASLGEASELAGMSEEETMRELRRHGLAVTQTLGVRVEEAPT